MTTPTRIALISDLHGNLCALESVLANIDRRGVDAIVCLGDVATLGPRPLEVLHLVADRATCIRGNHDEYLLDGSLSDSHNEHPVIRSAVDWCRAELSAVDRARLARFSDGCELELSTGCWLQLFHATPRSTTEDLLADTPVADVDAALAGSARATVLAGGHTHLQLLRQHRGRLIVNPRSVGMPFESHVQGAPPVVLAHAEYAIVEAKNGGLSVELCRVALDAVRLRDQLIGWREPLAGYLAAQYAHA